MPNVPMDQYVADRFDGPPSLNSGLAHVLLSRSALHCWTRHARLNPGWQPDNNREFDLGTAAHAVLLENKPLHVVRIVDEKTGEVIEPTDYKKQATQKARNDAKAAGQLPVLAHQAPAIEQMTSNARAKIALCPDLEGIPHSSLRAEQTIRWEREGVWLRCRPDWLTADARLIVSVKTTRASAEPNAFLRTLIGSGYHCQAAFELAGVQAVTGVDAAYVWLAVETEPPYAASLLGLDPAFRAFAMTTFRKAVSVWAACVAREAWPAYESRIVYPELPPWVQAQFVGRHGYDAPTEADADRPIEEVLFEKGVLP